MTTKKTTVEKPKKTRNLTEREVKVIVEGSFKKAFDNFLEKQTKTDQSLRGLMRETTAKGDVTHIEIVETRKDLISEMEKVKEDVKNISKPSRFLLWGIALILLLLVLLIGLVRSNKTTFEETLEPVNKSIASVRDGVSDAVAGLKNLRVDVDKNAKASDLESKRLAKVIEDQHESTDAKIKDVSDKIEGVNDSVEETRESVSQIEGTVFIIGEKVEKIDKKSSAVSLISTVVNTASAPEKLIGSEDEKIIHTPVEWDGRVSANNEPIVEQYKRIYTLKYGEFTPWLSRSDIVKGRVILPKIDEYTYIIIDYNDCNPFTPRRYSDESLPVTNFVQTKWVNGGMVDTLNLPQDAKRVRFYLVSPRPDEEPLVVKVLDSRNRR